MTLQEAIRKSMSILKQVMEEKLNETNVEVATVTSEGFKILSGEELQEYIRELS
jgi:20S proteasome subunit alpha 5